MGRVLAWLRVWWLRVPEPRAFSIGWGVAYLVLCMTGLSALHAPPHGLVGEVGGAAAGWAIGGLNIAGTLIAMVSGYFDFWKGERLGIGLAAGAAVIFGGILLYLNDRGSTVVALGYVLFSGVVLGVRYLMIRWYTFRPRG